MAELNHTFVTELDLATEVSASDCFLVSRPLSNITGNASDTGFLSKKLKYEQLCSVVLNGIDALISSTISSQIEDLSTDIKVNADSISAVSSLLDESISAIVKMANCIQTNKRSISALVSTVNNANITAMAGLSATKMGDLQYVVGHTNATSRHDDVGLLKFSYDSQGHVISSNAVNSTDIIELGNIISGATGGLAVNAQHQVYLNPAQTDTYGGIKLGYTEQGKNYPVQLDSRAGKAYVTVPWVDTKYSVGAGLSANGTKFVLSSATATSIGGVKVGDNLSMGVDGKLSARDTTYNIANAATAGLIKIGYASPELSNKNYAVQLANGKAYVHVPWTDTQHEFDSGVLTCNALSTISAISYSDGNVTGISASNALARELFELSGKMVLTTTLSDCITVKNGEIDYNLENGEFTLRGGSPKKEIAFGSTTIPTVISGWLTSTAYYEDGEGDERSKSGTFVELSVNSETSRARQIYVDVGNLETNVDNTTIGKNTSKQLYVKSIASLSGDLTATMATKDFVNSSIASNTAHFQGTYQSVSELPKTASIKNNDYAFVVLTSETNPEYKRYKYTSTAWTYEYTLNNSSFTAEQWSTINSGFTTADKTKLNGVFNVDEMWGTVKNKVATHPKSSDAGFHSCGWTNNWGRPVYCICETVFSSTSGTAYINIQIDNITVYQFELTNPNTSIPAHLVLLPTNSTLHFDSWQSTSSGSTAQWERNIYVMSK